MDVCNNNVLFLMSKLNYNVLKRQESLVCVFFSDDSSVLHHVSFGFDIHRIILS
jgi:hypothetical protein